MKLNKEGVEKAADVRSRRLFGAPLQDLSEDAQQVITGLVSDELTAYFDHLRQAGLMREAMGILAAPYGSHWVAATQPTTGDFKATIIKAEEQTNGEA